MSLGRLKCRSLNAIALILALMSLLMALLGIRQSLVLSNHHRSTMLPNSQASLATEVSSVTNAENHEQAVYRQSILPQKKPKASNTHNFKSATVDAAVRLPPEKSSKDQLHSKIVRHSVSTTADTTKSATFRGYARQQQHSVVELLASDLFPQRQPNRTTDDTALSSGGVDLQGNSSTTTVMGKATDYNLTTYQIFVGSLRRTGFSGHILLGLQRNASQVIVDYLQSQNVTIQWIDYTDCVENNKRRRPSLRYRLNITTKPPQCVQAYPNLKPRWSRFPLAADWLRDCQTCTGPVLIMDVRDSYFQRDPFGPGSPTIQGLHVFEEDPSQTTQHWITSWPLRQCKGVAFTQPMLCSGTTVGTRSAMLRYLQIMYQEMMNWTQTEHCQFHIPGDDQSIHNYLFYMGHLPFAKAIPNRSGGIVNTVGKMGSIIHSDHVRRILRDRPAMNETMAGREPFEGANDHTWIGSQFNITDSDGFFIEEDGTRSRVIHQWDRFGPTLSEWLEQQSFVTNG